MQKVPLPLKFLVVQSARRPLCLGVTSYHVVTPERKLPTLKTVVHQAG